MSALRKLEEKYKNSEISSDDALKILIQIMDEGVDFIKQLILKEEELKLKLSENLDLYKSKNLMPEYDKTFSQWNKSNLVLWDLKDILCRMGEDLND
jgi:hypothetical protein